MLNNYFFLNFEFKDNSFIKKLLDFGSTIPHKVFKENNCETIIIGHPSTNRIIDIHKLYLDLKKNEFSNNFIKLIDGEFLIININYSLKEINAYNSRFASPPLFFYFKNNNLLLSNNFFKIASYLKKNSKFSIDQNSMWHFLKFRRIFGVGTLDINTKYLKPAHRITVKNQSIFFENYWEPNFKKNNLSLKENANILSETLQKSWNYLLSDKKKPGIFLSGGLDSRSYLAHCTKKIKCINLTYEKNRESYASKKTAELTNNEYFWKKIDEGIYPKYLEKSSCVNSSMYIMDAIYYGNDEILKDIDVIFSGYGGDWFFQGFYLPYNYYKIGRYKLYYKKLKNIEGDLVKFFLQNFSAAAKGYELENLVKDADLKNFNFNLENTLNSLDLERKHLTENNYDRFENLAFGYFSRHYTYGAISALKEHKEHRLITFTNEIYDHYLNVPHTHRIEGKIFKESLKMKNPELLELISGNTGFKIKYGTKMQTFLSGLKFMRQNFKSGLLKRQRTWLPLNDLVKKELREEIIKLKKDDTLDQIQFLDRDKLNKFLDNFEVIDNPGHIPMLLLTFKSFFKNL